GRNADDILHRQADAVVQSRKIVEELRETGTQNQRILEEYRRVLEEAKTVFNGLDQQVAKVLTTVNAGMRDYVQTVENNFGVIVKHSNDFLPEISRTLQTQTQQLERQLDELTGAFDRALKGRPLGGNV